jgi:transposase IS66 family protein
VGSQGRRRLSGAGRGAPVSLTEDPTGVGVPASRGSACLEDLLGGFRGILQCDFYSAYGTHPAITLAVCWAHLRRKFHEALQTRQTLATGPLKAIARLYKVEKDLRQSRATPEQRAA